MGNFSEPRSFVFFAGVWRELITFFLFFTHIFVARNTRAPFLLYEFCVCVLCVCLSNARLASLFFSFISASHVCGRYLCRFFFVWVLVARSYFSRFCVKNHGVCLIHSHKCCFRPS